MALGCDILFDRNEHGVYLSGQVLSGRVEITLDKPKKLKGISLYIEGAAFCKWSEVETQQNRLFLRRKAVVYRGRQNYLSSVSYLVPFNADGVHITIGGQARTRWNERKRHFHNGRPKSEEIFYQADETYLDTKAYLKKGQENGSDPGLLLELPKGKHVYTFACALPPMLPTSFEGLYGHIRYTVKVVLERPWKFDQTFKVAFTVLKELDLNQLSPILRLPTQMETATNFWCGPCTSGIFSMVATVPQSGYVAGEVINIVAEVTNMTNVPVDYMKCSLRKVVLYKSQVPHSKTKVEFDVVQERRSGHVVEKMSHGRIEIQLAIPPIPPTNNSLCKVIEITYEIKVEARVSGPHNNPSIIIPLTIGTVPLTRDAPSQPSILTTTAITEQPTSDSNGFHPSTIPLQYSENGLELQPIMSTIINAQRNQRVDLPPPSYEESQTGNHQIEDDEELHPIRQQPYTPRYQVYHFDESAAVPTLSPIIEEPLPQASTEPRVEEQPVEVEVLPPSHAIKLQEKIDSWQ